MKQATKDKLQQAMDQCNAEGRSTAYMIQYMQDCAGVGFDCVMAFLRPKAEPPKKG